MTSSSTLQLKKLLQLFTLLFALAGLGFLVFPDLLLENINRVSAYLFESWPTVKLGQERFWLSLTGSLMATLTALAYFSQKDPLQKKELILLILWSKLVSTALFLTFFFTTTQALAYLVGAATDGSIFVILTAFYLKALSHAKSSL